MVAFARNTRAAADVFQTTCARYPLPDPYAQYFLQVLVSLLDLQEADEIQEFFNQCGLDALVVEIPVSKKEAKCPK